MKQIYQVSFSVLKTKNDKIIMNDEIEASTYKKWFGKYSEEKAHFERELKRLKHNNQDRWTRLKKLLPKLTDLPKLYEKLNIRQKHFLLNRVFNQPLIHTAGSSLQSIIIR
ncbi:hypothetical protein [Parapedobacter tibetensis]|uniref:hypothetical protein n=1 Tax=Parapedobacter tibetensis TaxID=2972951 RepID=UPI00214DD3A7|nr:hypothetical protein [Parapedobacter tibetensis]